MTKLDAVIQLRITLLDSKPVIWRQVLLPANYSFGDLHFVIQTAFGWENCHLHMFKQKKRVFGPAMDEPLTDQEDEDDVLLAEVFTRRGSTLSYVYDFGDKWQHEIKLEKTLRPRADLVVPSCIGGKRAGPPEDVGGVWGYNDIVATLAATAEQKTEREQLDDEVLEWLGDDFDPSYFVVDEVNELFARYANLAEDEDGNIDEGELVYSDGRLWNYDAAVGPNPKDWQRWDEDERVLAIEEYHRCEQPHEPADNPKMHALLHTVVETQLSNGEPSEIGEALVRLTAEGLNRHEAIHAMGTLVAEMLFAVLDQGRDPDIRAYRQALADLSARQWLAAVQTETSEHTQKIRKKPRPTKGGSRRCRPKK